MFCKLVSGFAIAILSGFCAFAQQPQCAYQVNFKDKNHTPFSLSTPASYLSARALTRRTTQGIAIDSSDLPVNQTYMDSVLAVTGGIFHEASKWKNLMVVLVNETDTPGIMGKFALIHAVAGAQLVGYYGGTGLHSRVGHVDRQYNPPVQNTARTTSDATYYNFTWNQTHMVNGNVLHDEGHWGQGKMIAILDAGFYYLDTCPYGFDSLRNSGRIVDEHNFSYSSDFIYSYDNHGTIVLSTMAGYVPDTFVGTAPQAMYALYITEIEPTEQPLELVNLICGVERADSIGADIITCSLGYNTFDNPAYNFDETTQFDGKTTLAAQAVNIATQKGMLFVASAGNEGDSAAPYNLILTPGDADSALTIGSVTPGGSIALSSGYGPNNAGNIKPDVCAQGQPANIVDGAEYSSGNGTSFATPQIAGWAACLWSAHPEATPSSLRRAIDSCASIHSTPDSHYGYGIADFSCADFLLKVTGPTLAINHISVAPNPVSDQLTIKYNLAAPGSVTFRIVDMWGRIVYSTTTTSSGNTSEIQISTSGLATGVYLLHAQNEQMSEVVRVVKL